jgi:uncharacterized repeat protein (TIGR03803 family)
MKIESVGAIPVEIPLNKVFGGSGYRVANRNPVVIRIRTAEAGLRPRTRLGPDRETPLRPAGIKAIRAGRSCISLLATSMIALATAGAAIAETGFHRAPPPGFAEQTIHDFCAQSGCGDGAIPAAGLIMDAAGNLYGTTAGTGYSSGTAFKLAPTGTAWNQTVLYGFCSQTNCADGGGPIAHLIMDGAGNLYGTTFIDGGYGAGTVFKLAPSGSAWVHTVLWRFCSSSSCADGYAPSAGLLMDGAGNLYGTTESGGASGGGTVFRLAPTSTGWTETVLYSFCSQPGCADGKSPMADLLMDGAGNLYGTTSDGGSYSRGTVFRLAPINTGWSETVLYSFCSQSGCTDGYSPQASLVADGAGSLYGTTYYGGVNNHGTVFQLAPTGNGWVETVLYRFCSQTNCADGAGPSSLIMDGSGSLYGTTAGGGTGGGAIFQLAPTSTGWTETVLYSFCSQSQCTDGNSPTAGVMMDQAGTLYGTTALGGRNNDYECSKGHGCGVVFQLANGYDALSVSVAGIAGGRVTSSPSGIDCGATCSASFAPGTQVTLAASPATAWGFSGWGGVCSGLGSCTVTMDADKAASAAFAPLFTAPAPPVASTPTDEPLLPPPVIAPIPQ